jgi:hypothetical protein
MKIVINNRHGGFSLSHEAIIKYLELKGIKFEFKKSISGWANDEYHLEDGSRFWNRDILRNDPALVQVVEEMGEEANGDFAHLKVVEIPDDVEWTIDEYDGLEWVAEQHRTWR